MIGWCGWLSLVFLSTFPVVIPFIFMRNVGPARWPQCHRHSAVVYYRYAFGRMTHPSVVGRNWDGGSRSMLVGLTKALRMRQAPSMKQLPSADSDTE
jgi:hypothetical protein